MTRNPACIEPIAFLLNSVIRYTLPSEAAIYGTRFEPVAHELNWLRVADIGWYPVGLFGTEMRMALTRPLD
jgi:hypothetical protein